MGGPATPAGLIGHVSGTQCINWAWPFPSTGREPLAGLQMPGPSVLNIIVDGYLGRASADDRSWSSVDFDRAATDQSGGEGPLSRLCSAPLETFLVPFTGNAFYQRNPFLHSFWLKFRRILKGTTGEFMFQFTKYVQNGPRIECLPVCRAKWLPCQGVFRDDT